MAHVSRASRKDSFRAISGCMYPSWGHHTIKHLCQNHFLIYEMKQRLFSIALNRRYADRLVV